MNAKEVFTNATGMAAALTPREGTTALVKKDILEMDIIVQVCFLSVCYSIFYDILCPEVDEQGSQQDKQTSKQT